MQENDKAQETEQETLGISDCAKAIRLYKEILTEALPNSESLKEKYEEVIKSGENPRSPYPEENLRPFLSLMKKRRLFS